MRPICENARKIFKNDENTPALKNAVSEQNFENPISPTPIIKHKKPKYEIWCHSDTGRKSGTIHVTEETEVREQ